MAVLERAFSQEVGADGWPPYLYKYRALRSELDLERAKRILDGFLFAAHRSQFNDPFDCAPVLEVRADAKEVDTYIKGVVDRASPNANRAERRRRLSGARHKIRQSGAEAVARNALDMSYDESGIISLTVKPDDLLMWGHYGSEHTGVCFRFDLREKGAAFRCAFPVGYTLERPVL